MTHRSEQSEHVPGHITSQTARDLAWLLTTPDVVELPPPMPCGGRPTQQELGLQDDVDKWLAQLAPLISTLDGKLGTRMGHYHERLWHLLLDNAPNTRLLASNVKITHKRTTLGELDMLYRTRGNPAPVHLEVAIKFYLGLPEGPGDASSQSRWIGPGGLDSLALKCSHLRRHQLPISSTATALAIIAHWLAPRDLGPTPSLISQLTQRLAMPGVLFYPWHTEIPPPIGATANHRRGLWCHLKDWPALAAERSAALQMAWLEKPHWLAPPPQGAFHPTSEEIARVRPLIERYGPQQVMLYDPAAATTTKTITKTITKTSRERHMERLIIVPNDWPRQVPLPPYTRD